MFAKQYYMATVLCHSILENNISVARDLLRKGADPNFIFDDDSSAIHLACSRDADDTGFVSLLLQFDANPNLRNSCGLTPVHTSAACGNVNIIRLLLTNGGSAFQKDDDGRDAFSWAQPHISHSLRQFLSTDEMKSISGTRLAHEDNSNSGIERGKISSTTDSDSNFFSSPSSCTTVTQLSDLSCFNSKVVLSDVDGYSLIETCVPPDSILPLDVISNVSDSSDWRSYSRSYSDTPADVLSTRSVKVPDEIGNLTDIELRRKLMEFEDCVGPVVRSTRRTLEMKLMSHLQCSPLSKTKHAPQEFLTEVNQALSGRLDESMLNTLEEEMTLEFINPLPEKNWREGVQKVYFNYLLLDPRVTQNLPVRAKHMDRLEAFKIFLQSVFYIGKGRQSRPYEHFKEATSHGRKTSGNLSAAENRKVKQILDIWDSKMGVVSLHLFHNIIAVEAFTREACMIDALGLERLTNQCRGQFYGPCSTWNNNRKRLLGIWLLKRAFGVLINEGERQIKPQNV